MTEIEELQHHKAYLKENFNRITEILYYWFYTNDDDKEEFIANFVNNDIEKIESCKENLLKSDVLIGKPWWGWDMILIELLLTEKKGEFKTYNFKVVACYDRAIINLINTFGKLDDANLKDKEKKHIVTAFFNVIELARELTEQESWKDMITIVKEFEKNYMCRKGLPK